MAKEIEIDTNILANDIETMQSLLDSINADMDRMYDAVHVLNTMWEGKANAAFNVQFHKDQADMRELCKLIQKIIGYLRFAKDNYNKCENQVSSIVNSIKI